MVAEGFASRLWPHSKGESAAAVKECPRCGALLFGDMDICYGCLYDFSRERVPSRDPAPSDMELEEPDICMGPDEREAQGVESAPCESLSPDDTILTECLRHLPATPARSSLFVCTSDVDVCVPLPDGGLTVGRSPANDIVLHGRDVSRSHALFRPTAAGALVEDLGATNPVICRLGELRDSVEIRAGESVDICGARFTLVVPTREG